MNLSSCQQNALKVLESDNNVFLTGVAGSGKSFLLQKYLQNRNSKTHAVVASTGAAAVLVGGVTYHSFFGLGIMEGGLQKTIERALKDKRLKKRLEKIQTLVIDEISMISGLALQAGETVARLIRSKDIAWGGIKIIAVGDFGQLPPITQYSQNKDWAFLSPAWEKSDFKVAYLQTILRSQDKNFLEVLNYVRNGIVNDTVSCFLNSKIQKNIANFKGTRLFSHKRSVEDFNLKELENIKSPLKSFETEYVGQERFLEQIKKTAPLPETLHVKEGALVMIRKNDPLLSYVNGSLGTLTHIEEDRLGIELLNGRRIYLEPESFSYMNAEGEVVAAATNFPINLAWATTIHKSQGMTLDAAFLDLSQIFEEGQAYVALSRLKSSDALYLSSWNPKAIRASKDVEAFHKSILSDYTFL